MDFLLGDQGYGSVAATLIQNNFDPRALRPWVGDDGNSYITVTNGAGQPSAKLVRNAVASLRKDEWIALDRRVVEVARQRLRLVQDIRGAGLVYNLPNGMGTTVLQTQTSTDTNDASMSMDGVAEGRNDRLEFNLASLPIPIIHKDFEFTARQIATSRQQGTPLDLLQATIAARKVAELAEKLFLGVSTYSAFAGANLYGLTNYPQRLTKTLTAPTGSNNATVVAEFLAMREQAYAVGMYGPFMVYTSPAWDAYLDQDYSTSKGNNTLRERLKAIEGFQDVRRLDYLTGTQAVLVQMTEDVIRLVQGMDITTLQWEQQGGMVVKFKVMAIWVPQVRSDANAACGVVHGSV